MGCLASQKKIEDRLTPLDYKIIWNKCLKVDKIVITQHKRTQHPVFVQIAKDIDRTFPNHPYFQDIYNKKRFEKVLRKFALQFPKVGYTQGLNFITGFLLITGLTEQESIKTLIALLTHPELMLIGLYQDDFPLCRLYCDLFWSLSKKICPQGYKYIKSIALPNQVWIFQWFITFFIYSLPFSYIKDLLNFIVVKRYFAAVRLAVAIFFYLQKYIATITNKQDGFLDCLQLMKSQQFCKKYLPIENLIKKAQKIKKQMIQQCLRNSQETNQYKQYFTQTSANVQKKYNKFLQDSQSQRQKFIAEQPFKHSGRVSRYIKIPQSMTIIDNIQESVSKKFQKALYRSSLDKNTPFFSRLSSKNYNSVAIHEFNRVNTLK